ncbi:hypothetical protein D9756_009757 [Leucocoprinus leucothites]|uniref:UPF3 domain-containing protein n=1 Tax=Leucocoprinus leucothites TaxID=201217 RepID=A0A8H5CYE0_9AGAR|nr:hypothetical protein D9756_009757 [Leucoagaricus leucothites]
MSTPAPANPPTPSKSRAKKAKDKDKDKERKEKTQLPGERLKIVVRRLPPNLPEEIFWQSVSDWVTDTTVSWKAYYPGKPKKRANKENISSRAYIAFKTPDQVSVFGREYDGHKFVDKAGIESFAVVEYAPYQKVPGEKKKPDSRHATIEKDEDYISFVESLNASSATEPTSIEALIASARPPSPPKTTPLLEALRVEKQAQKDKEAIIRNHPHYKDLLNGPSPSALRKEEKRKAARAEAAAAKKAKKGPPASSKPVQIQAKPSVGPSHAPTTALPLPGKPQPSPARSSRKHTAKTSKESVHAPPSAPSAPAATQKDTVPPAASTPKAQSLTPAGPQEAMSTTTTTPAPARRGRPVLGLGSRQFEAALSGVGVAGERKRRENGKDTTSAAPAPSAPGQEGTSQVKPHPPTSPKRPRHQKGGSGGFNPAATAPAPDANGASVLTVPAVQHVDGSGRGGRRGRGRGRGGPPRVG